LLINRKACGGDNDLPEGMETLKAAGIDVAVDCVEDPAVIPLRIRDDRSADIVIIGGGDGTLNAAVEEVLASRRPLGLLPMGNANDLARTLGIPPSLPAASEIIARGHRRRIDLGRVNGKHFFNAASVGMSTRIAKKLKPDIKRRWRLMGYTKSQ